MKHIHKYIFASITILLLTAIVPLSSNAFDSQGDELETMQKDCKQYLKDPKISKELKTICKQFNAKVNNAFNAKYNDAKLKRSREKHVTREVRHLKQLKLTKDRLYNDYINSICTNIGIRIVQKLSDREYGIYYNERFAKLYTSETSFTSKGRASIYVYKNSSSEKVTYKTGFSESVNRYRECSRRDKEKHLKLYARYDKAYDKWNPEEKKAKEEARIKLNQNRRAMGCEELSKNTDKGTIYGSAQSILEDGFWFYTYGRSYYVKASNASAKSILSNSDRKIIVKRTGRTRRFSLYELYPYQTKNGESEYSKRAIQHVRRYPVNKFKTLEEVSLVGLWDSLCK